jgi:hypothetical protein
MRKIDERIRIRSMVVSELINIKTNGPAVSKLLLLANIYIELTATSLSMGFDPLSISLCGLSSVPWLLEVVRASKDCPFYVC